MTDREGQKKAESETKGTEKCGRKEEIGNRKRKEWEGVGIRRSTNQKEQRKNTGRYREGDENRNR